MPIRKDLYEKMIADREADEREARKESRRHWILTLLVCWGWCLAGGAITVWGFHVVDPVNGPIAVRAGPLLAAAGTLLTISIAARRRADRGEE
ncbi:MAG TPA: hypothetical protein VNP72_11180 [Longimicrobium sp.]|nr:hypothetical protein [Longimicrobium sp.]